MRNVVIPDAHTRHAGSLLYNRRVIGFKYRYYWTIRYLRTYVYYVDRFMFSMMFIVFDFWIGLVNGIVVLNHIGLVMAARSVRF